jgi:hypothetical protein
LEQAGIAAISAGARAVIVDYPALGDDQPQKLFAAMARVVEGIRSTCPEAVVGVRLPPLAWEFDSLGRSHRFPLYTVMPVADCLCSFVEMAPDFVCIDPLTVDTKVRSWVLPLPELVRGMEPLVMADIPIVLSLTHAGQLRTAAHAISFFEGEARVIADVPPDLASAVGGAKRPWAGVWHRVHPLASNWPDTGERPVVVRAGLGDDPFKDKLHLFASNAEAMESLVTSAPAGLSLVPALEARIVVLGSC